MQITEVDFSQTNIKDQGVNIRAKILGAGALKYKIIVNTYDSGFINITAPTNINRDIPAESFTLGPNLLTLNLSNPDESEEELFTYSIIKENRDTFSYQRRMEHDRSHTLSGTVLKHGEGIGLTNLGTGNVTVKIPTEGKGRIQNVSLVEENSGIVVGQLEIPKVLVGTVGDLKLKEAPIDNSVEDILSIEVTTA